MTWYKRCSSFIEWLYKDTLKPCVAGLNNKDGIKLSAGDRGTQKCVSVECSAWLAGVTANSVGLHAHHRTESCTYEIHSTRQCIDLRSSTRRWCGNVNTVRWRSARLHHQTLPAHATIEGRLSDLLSCAAPSGYDNCSNARQLQHTPGETASRFQFIRPTGTRKRRQDGGSKDWREGAPLTNPLQRRKIFVIW